MNQKFNGHLVKFYLSENTILLPTVIGSATINQFASTLNFWKSKRQYYRPLIIDFSGVQKPYSNGMLPIIALLTKLRLEGQTLKIILPNNRNIIPPIFQTAD